ncbi:MAG TPA: MBOAT family protein, partial [Candidatus Binatia bacterium]|nr:MBOAT family protein [Candidatus Binatia bacterium]
ARRYCLNGACRVPRRRRHWPVLLLPLCVPFVVWDFPSWLFMWAMAGALWLALKLYTFLDAPKGGFRRSVAYLLVWPGMDAPEFFANTDVARPRWREWFVAALNIGVGTALIYAGARRAYPFSPLLAGWLAMIGIGLVLHFGIFKWLALLWRAAGIPATPIMDAPLRSRSLSEFWGRRWNTGFSIPARRYLMEPIARRFGATAGLLTVFLVSGLVHELVISLPAKAGYGLPTLYFLIQALGMLCERARADRLSALRWLIIAVPAFILFHPPFVHRVIIPFLKVIGAL